MDNTEINHEQEQEKNKHNAIRNYTIDEQKQ